MKAALVPEWCELTILMPCLNEAETLRTCIEKASAFLVRSGVRGEILVADNGSIDGSQELARAHGAGSSRSPSGATALRCSPASRPHGASMS